MRWIAPFLMLFGVGCASTQGGLRTVGSPANGGLAVLEVVLEAERTHDPSSETVLKSAQPAGDAFAKMNEDWSPKITEGWLQRTDSLRSSRSCRAMAGLLVFSDLPPGPYALRGIGHPRILVEHVREWDVWFARREFTVTEGPESDPESPFEFEIGPGGMVYLGRIFVHASYEPRADDRGIEFLGRPGERIQIERNRSGEVRAWSALLDAAPKSPWAEELRQRIEILTSHEPPF
ncbi:MAG TPA: hypothetical protein VE402_08020 [Candidatus Angelobacter sp.]|nr:hypothetical protein [Candidatus Angelobacter sp.]